VIKFSERFNCFYDTELDIWLDEDEHKKDDCEFCKNRPDKPSLVKKKKFFSFNFNIFKRNK
jgi:hypothetical protein